MAKLEGRDINMMRAAPWKGADTSAVQKVSVPKNCTNEQLADAVKKMVIESVNVLYGDNTEEKYIKIVNLIMLRVRGALSQLAEEVEKKAESFDAESIVDKLSSKLSDLIEKNANRRDEEHFSKLKQMYDAVMQCIQDQNEKARSSSSSGSSQVSPESTEEDVGSDEWIEKQVETSENSIKLLAEISKQVSDGFSKMTKLIMSKAIQKTVQSALSSSSFSMSQSVVTSSKSKESSIQRQIQNLNTRIGLNKAGQPAEDAKSKKKKNVLKDVLTGKQFKMLTNMFTKQFIQMHDLGLDSLDKIKKGFKSVDERLDALKAKLSKKGFSLPKLLLFLSLFIIPVFWSQITGFISKINEKLNIDEKIKNFIDSIDWDSHISNVAQKIWNFLTEKFDKYIKDPIGEMIKATKKTYDSCVEWVRDLWKWVTGDDKGGENVKKESNQLKDQVKSAETRLNSKIEDFQNKIGNHAQEIETTAKNKSNEINESINSTNNVIVENKKTLEKDITKTVEMAENISNDIAKAPEQSLNNVIANDTVTKMQKSIEDGVNSAVKDATDQIGKDAKNVVESLNANGAPTKFNDAMMGAMEKAAGQVETAKDDLAEPNLSKFESIKDYIVVKDASDKNKKGNIIASRDDVNKTLGKMNQKTQSRSMQYIQNAVDLGQFDSNKNIIDTYKNKEDADEQKQRQAILDRHRSKKPELKEKISNEATDETPVEREARWYSTINGAYDAIVQNNDIMKNGISKNQMILEEIKKGSEMVFTDIRDFLRLIKENPMKNETNVGVASFQNQRNLALDPNMSS